MSLPKTKQIILSTSSITKMWLAVISGLTGLTQREMDVVEVIIEKRTELVTKGVKAPYLSEILFSTNTRKDYCTKLKISEYNLTNLLGALRKKKAIMHTDDGEDLFHNLLPAEEMVIKFVQTNDRGISNPETDSEEQQS